MLNINLNYNNSYKWYEENNIYVIGSIYYNNHFIENKEFINFVKENKKKLPSILKNITGFFSIVIVEEKTIKIISDIMRTFPVFYKIDKDVIELTDNIDLIKNKEINNNYLNEYECFLCVLEYNTIYKDVYQVQANEMVTINYPNIYREKYYNFDIDFNLCLKDKNKLIQKIDESFSKAIDRLIKYANGKTIVIPLSGGYDSRQIAAYLKEKKYNNVICYTYGKKITEEVLISKKVANFLNYKWLFIPYKNSYLQKLYYNKTLFNNLNKYVTRGSSFIHIQDWGAIAYLQAKKLIPEDSIIVPGYSGDALAGSHLDSKLLNNKKISTEEVIQFIIKMNTNWQINPAINNFTSRFKELLNANDEYIDKNTAINVLNKYDYEERQCKYISNGIRIYDYYKYKWYMPFWDKDYIKVWNEVNISLKFNRDLFKEYFNNKFNKLMEAAPIYNKKETPKKSNKISKIFNIIYLYYENNMNLYGYIKFKDYVKQIIKDRNVGYCYAFNKKAINNLKKEAKE